MARRTAPLHTLPEPHRRIIAALLAAQKAAQAKQEKAA